MEKMKYKNFRIGEYIFTVRIWDCGINCLGHREFDYEVCEWHQPPTNWWKRLFSNRKITVYSRDEWYSDLPISLEEDIINTCTVTAQRLDNLKRGQKMWEEL